MNPDLPPRPALSLQDKLDRIAHERDVLALQQQLAESGLLEGDKVLALDGGAHGRLLITRDQSPPRLQVLADDGTLADFSTCCWRRASRP